MSAHNDHPSNEKFVEWANSRTAWNVCTLASIGTLNILSDNGSKKLSVLDIGGGTGKFASILQYYANCTVDIVDPSSIAAKNSIASSNSRFFNNTFQSFQANRQYDAIFLNLVLHHMISSSYNEQETYNIQIEALRKARRLLNDGGALVVQENFYTGQFNSNLAGKLIYKLTSLKSLETITRKMGANTAGEGVRFRNLREWQDMLEKSGFAISNIGISPEWGNFLAAWKKILLFTKRADQGVIIAFKRQ